MTSVEAGTRVHRGEAMFVRRFYYDVAGEDIARVEVHGRRWRGRWRFDGWVAATVFEAPSTGAVHPNDDRARRLVQALNDRLIRHAILQHETPPPEYPELDMTALRRICSQP